VSIQRLPVKEFLQRSKNSLLLDVRSPAEYVQAHLPGAQSFPLFSDEERKIVGTAYKQESREKAIRIGLDIFGPKMRPMIEQVEAMLSADKKEKKEEDGQRREIFVYCWRGGMRSSGVAWLLDLYGWKVFTLAGGYKSFRNFVFQSFEYPFSFQLLGGYTGSGKTEVLNELGRNGETVIDLEQIACHKGSAFGSFKMPPQPRQEMFENMLCMELVAKSALLGSGAENHDRVIWLEDESQRIGNLNIPGAIWEKMRSAPIVFLEIPFEARLDHLEEEYGKCDQGKLIEAVERISKRLGGLEAKNAIAFLEAGNFREAFRILLLYYDKRYLKGLHNRSNLPAVLKKLHCDTVSTNNAQRLINYHTV
jgi:tRNA 2-selenouridine synthase